ncbi:cysteine desulfurase family protein [Streptantibioticus silvisoli]|uniref:cysteine desulfurase n=1 Tax=Streptantibioticus silvisoli TaxID=2705255 RepID=A0ABT6W864_9ACTN|nr:cysteine desulfurase family protein [Streptantibioticus silvisoli]MDI5966942.1 cysteine desulfurase family protein [Streptantibioticus silvisoli]
MRTIYLDHQATTPMDPAVMEVMQTACTQYFANPASPHAAGVRAFREVERARSAVARFVGGARSEIYFTSGATEANNIAIKGMADRCPGGHIVTAATEHKSVLDTCAYLREKGWSVTVLPVDAQGQVTADQVAGHLRDDTVLVSVMLANNEIGTIQPIAEIGRVTRQAGVALHCDATQGVGSLAVDVTELGVDLLTFSGHKIYGPKGVGALYISNRLTDTAPLAPLMHGGGQERGLRAGTHNTAAIIGLGTAVTLVEEVREQEARRLEKLRHAFLTELTAASGTPFRLNSGTGPDFLPHTLNLSLEGVDAQDLLPRLAGLAISTGSACNSSAQEPSHVLRAIGLPPEQIKGSIRLSFGRFTQESDAIDAARYLAGAALPEGARG